MLVFGGNTHNDTSMSHGAKCFSSDFMAYDIGKFPKAPFYLQESLFISKILKETKYCRLKMVRPFQRGLSSIFNVNLTVLHLLKSITSILNYF